MAQRYINPLGNAVFILLAGELLAISAAGNDAAVISVHTAPGSSNPGGFIETASVSNASAEVGPYDEDREVMIQAGNCLVRYDTGAAPVLTSGEGLVAKLPDGAVLMTNDGVPDETIGVGFAGPGSLCIDFNTPTLYINTGDATTPDWVALAVVTP